MLVKLDSEQFGMFLTLLTDCLSILIDGWTSKLFISLYRDPIRTYSVSAIFKLSLFADSQFRTFFRSSFALFSTSITQCLSRSCYRLVSSTNILGVVYVSGNLESRLYSYMVRRRGSSIYFPEECRKFNIFLCYECIPWNLEFGLSDN